MIRRRDCAGGRMARLLVVAAALAAVGAGCRPVITFPSEPTAATGRRADYDTNDDGEADFFLLTGPDGRADRIAFDDDGDGKPDRIVHMDAINPRLSRHLVVILDGIPYDVAREFYASGRLRLFHPPAVVIPPYPVMTDLAMEDALGYMPCLGFEAYYYDRRTRSLAGGARDYLSGRNEPFARIIDYRASALDDVWMYLRPEAQMAKELAQAKRVWDRRDKQEAIVYFVASAGVGSRRGKEGQLEVLRQAEQMINQVVLESGGLVKVTLMADHGQTNVPCEPVKLRQFLRGKGYRVTDRVEKDEDVAVVRFGLVTCAVMGTRRPERLVEDLIECQAVSLASYAEGDAVVVRSRSGQARIRSTDGKTFEYEQVTGDPLDLAALTAGGKIDGRRLLRLTSDGRHEYPDALYRLWRAHFALAENTPDVIVSLDDRYCNGSGFFAGLVSMASTHGGLNWRNSATFIMSTAGAIEGPLRSEDIPGVIGGLFARPFPLGR